MTDRELLELAAKAAGIRHIEYTNDYDGRDGLMLCDEIGRHTSMWNPLTDDGDALRLAVKLRLEMYYTHAYVVCRAAPGLDSDRLPVEMFDNDPYAATRRAIVRAAAEIGRRME